MAEIIGGFKNLAKDAFDAVNTYEVRKVIDKVTGVVMNYTEAEARVREATSEEPWGPTGPLKEEVAQSTFQHEAFPEVMGMLWKRMFTDNKNAWRRVYKSLLLLDHLLKHGSERVVNNAKEHAFELRGLEHFNCKDERGVDQGINVRHRVKEIIDLLQDDAALRRQRKEAKSGKKHMTGISSDDYGTGRHSFGDSGRSRQSFDKMAGFKSSSSRNGSSHFGGGKESGEADEYRDNSDDANSNTFEFPDDDAPTTRASRRVRRRSSSPELGIPDNVSCRRSSSPRNQTPLRVSNVGRRRRRRLRAPPSRQRPCRLQRRRPSLI